MAGVYNCQRLVGKTGRWTIVCAMAAVSVTAAIAQGTPEGFRSPTGNIQCLFFDASAVRCSISSVSSRLPHRPADCELEWGHDFGLEAKSRQGERLCVGDTIADNYPILPYGESARHGGVVCHSARKGVTCTNVRGAGFELSRSLQRVF